MIAVIGAGKIGSFIADSLARNNDVLVFDRSEESLSNCRIANTVRGDIATQADKIRRSDIIVIALPGSVSLETAKTAVGMGIDVVDVSFAQTLPHEIGDLAARNSSVYVPHCGFAPGLTNMLAGMLVASGFDEEIQIYCGGLPVDIQNPLGYNVTWSTEGLIDEYVRPARFLRNGEILSVDPLSSIEEIAISEFGTFEAFHTDGLSTLLDTRISKNIIEKTLRYPGHLEKMRFLRDLGLFSDRETAGISNRKFMEGFLESLPGNGKDFCLLQVSGHNAESGSTFTGYCGFDELEGRSAMCRITGAVAVSVAESLLSERVDKRGILTMEELGLGQRSASILDRLSNFGISIRSVQREKDSR